MGVHLQRFLLFCLAASGLITPFAQAASSLTEARSFQVADARGAAKSDTATRATKTLKTSSLRLRDRKDVLISAGGGEERLYYIEVPPGANKLVLMTSGGRGDLQLIMSRGTPPTGKNALARTDSDSNPLGPTYQRISVDNPASDTYYLLVRSGPQGYDRVNLRGRFDFPSIGVSDDFLLYNGLPQTVDTNKGDQLWKFYAPQGVDLSSISFELKGGKGNADIFVQKGTRPSPKNYLGKSGKPGNNEAVTLSAPEADPGVYYVLVTGKASGAALTAKWTTQSIKFGIHAHRLYNGNGENYNDDYKVRRRQPGDSASMEEVDEWGLPTPGGGHVVVPSGCRGACLPFRAGLSSPPPVYPYSTVRHWDIELIPDATVWTDGSRTHSEINFSMIDQIYKGHASAGAKMLKTFAMVPRWAAKRPMECNRPYHNYVGGLSGPADWRTYKKFVYDYVKHAYENGWLWAVEGWNEPYSSRYHPVPSNWYPTPEDRQAYQPQGNVLNASREDLWPCSAAAKNGYRGVREQMVEFTTMPPEDLANHQRAVWEATKAVDPTLLVLSPANAYVAGIETILRARTPVTKEDPVSQPITKYFDVLGWHAYTKRAQSNAYPFRVSDPSRPGREDYDKEITEVKSIVKRVKHAHNVPIYADIPLADTEHGWLPVHPGGEWWHSPDTTDEARGTVLFETAKKAKERGLIGVWWYGHDNHYLGKPMKDRDVNAPVSRALQRMHDELEMPKH